MMILILPLMLPMSFFAYVSPFAWIRAVPLFAALACMIALRKKDNFAVTQWGWWALLTYVFDVSAWMFSRHEVPQGTGKMIWASRAPTYSLAGFPLRALEIPPGAMGGNRPEMSQWPIVIGNLCFWAACAAVIVFWPKLRETIRFEKVLRWNTNGLWPWVGAFLVHQYTLFMFMIWFD